MIICAPVGIPANGILAFIKKAVPFQERLKKEKQGHHLSLFLLCEYMAALGLQTINHSPFC